MSGYFESEEYEVDYKRPPISGQFRKGTSGNPSGRPRQPTEIAAAVMRELDSPLFINVKGKRKAIKKRAGVAMQLVNKSVSGHLPSTRMVLALQQQELEKSAEPLRQSPISIEHLDVENMTTQELLLAIRKDLEREIKADLEKSIRARLEKSIRAEYKKAMRNKSESRESSSRGTVGE